MTDTSRSGELKLGEGSAQTSLKLRRQQLITLKASINAVLEHAEQLAVPYVSIHLDHAAAICAEELAKMGRD